MHCKLVAMATLSAMALTCSATAALSAPTSPHLDVVWVETSHPTDGAYRLGDVVTWDLRVTNVSDSSRSVRALASNTQNWQPCKWHAIAAGQTKTDCHGFIQHTITATDVSAHSFTPSIEYALMDDTSGSDTVVWRGTVSGSAVSVNDSWPKAEPAPVPDVSVDTDGALRLRDKETLASSGAGTWYRIPAMTAAPNGDLLVSYDRRPGSAGDAPNPNSIVQRRSTDNGRTWGPETVVHAGHAGADKYGFSDPSYLVDPHTGAIFNFHVKSYDQGFAGSRTGVSPEDRNVLHAEVSTSLDNGHTWTHRDITGQITPDPTTRTRFVASGQHIALRYGPHAGRLVAQMTVRNAAGQQAQSIFSDDHGATWQAGEPVGSLMDENKVVELSDGTLMLNSRDAGQSGFRKVAYSHDGGQTWGPVTLDKELIDPTNNAQLIRAFPNAPLGSAKAKILLFTNARDAKDRVNGTLSVSCDDGDTWALHETYQHGTVGYTTVAVQSDGAVGMLWEDDGIHYANTSMAWLPKVCPAAGEAQEASPSPSATPSQGAVTTVPTPAGGSTSRGASETNRADQSRDDRDGVTVTVLPHTGA